MKRARSPRRLLHPQDHGALEDIALHPQLGVLAAQPLQLLDVRDGQPVGALTLGTILGTPVPQRALVDPEIAGDLRNRFPGLPDDPHSPLTKLLVELPSFLRHDYSS